MAELPCEPPPAYIYESNVHFGNILVSLNEQRKRGLLCDISVIVQENEFKAHKAILASCSTYFDKIITDPANVSHNIVLELSSISKVGMESLLEFAYTSKLTVNLANIDDVICAARELEFKNIEFSCLNYLKQQLLAGKSSSSFLGSQETTSFCGNSTISRQVEPSSKPYHATDCKSEKQLCSKVEKTCPSLKINHHALSKKPFVPKSKCHEANQGLNHNDSAKQDLCEQMSQEQHQAMIKKILEQHGLEPATVDERAMDVAATETAISCHANNQKYASSEEKKICGGYLSPVYNSDTDEACSLDGEIDGLCQSRPCGKLRKQPAIKLPFTMEEITSMPRSDLHDMLTKSPNLTQEQICAIHEIRRRGKNRIAAQRCRKRKMECIKSLVAEIETLRSEHARLMKERRDAREQAITLSDKFKAKCEKFFKSDKKGCLIKKFCSGHSSLPANQEQAPMSQKATTAHNFQEHAQQAHQLCQKLKEAPSDDLPPCPLLSGDANVWAKPNDSEEVICTVLDDGLEANYQVCSPSSAYVMSPSQGLRNDFGNIHISPTAENNAATITQARTTVLQHTNASKATLPPFSSLVMPVTAVIPNAEHLNHANGRDATMTDLSTVPGPNP